MSGTNVQRSGYKDTAVGWIPDDWNCSTLGAEVEFLDSQRVPIKASDRDKRSGIYPYYGASGIIDYVDDYIFDGELILLGEDGANITDRSKPLAFRISGKTWVNNHAHVIRPKDGMAIGYLCEYLESINYIKYNTGSAQPKLNREVCEAIPIPKPPFLEQHIIGKILSACDLGFDNISSLIEAKEEQKWGLMQLLLTGKKRFPEFGDEPWQEVRLGDVFKKSTNKNDGSKVTTPITVSKYGIRLQSEHFNKSVASKDVSPYWLLKQGQFVYDPMSAYYGAIGRNDLPEAGIVSPAYRVLNLQQGFDSDFMSFFVKSHEVLFRLEQASSQNNKAGKRRTLGHGEFEALKFSLPLLPEQIRIGQILNVAVREIELLKKLRDAIGEQKRGLMQKLLTGEVRVKVDEKETA